MTPGAGGTTDVRVRLDSAPNRTYNVEFYSAPIESPTAFLEATTFISAADIAVGPSCVFDGVINLPGTVPAGFWVTATADGISELAPPPVLRIDDVTAAEGDTGTTDLSFTASLSAPWHSTLIVEYTTTDDTATAPSDYAATSGTLSFAQGETSKTVTVAVNGDTDVEPDERFFVDLSGFSLGADAIEDGRGRGTITNDDGTAEPPALTIDDVRKLEGDAGTTDFVFTVTRTGDLNGPSSVRYHTIEGTAHVPEDFVPVADALLSFAPGKATRQITIKVKGDGKRAPNETFSVRLSQPTGALIADGTGVGTTINDDPYLVAHNTTVTEPAAGSRIVTVRVTLSYPTPPTVTVRYRTRDGTARAGSDYRATSGTLTFAPGQTSRTIAVTVLADARSEPDETFFVVLSNPEEAFIRDATARVTIRGLRVARGRRSSDLSRTGP